MTESACDTLPRRPRRARIGLAAIALLGVCTAAVWRFSWWAPPTYLPGPVVPRGQALDSAGHDKRTLLIGDGPYILHIEPDQTTSGQGALLFFGSRHSKDPQHPQLAALRHAWDTFHPTVALVEGRMSFFVGTPTQGIRIFGEPAAVYSLAQHSGIPIYTLEPPLDVEIAALEECGDRTQVAMFRVLSGYISARRGGPVSDFKINRLLSKRASPLTSALPTIETFDAYFKSQSPELPGWRDLPEEAMWPGKSDTLLHRMATRSNRARDEHFVRAMLDLVNRGERVLVIAGRSHAVIQEPVLWESLQPAVRGGLSSPRPWENNDD